MFAFFPWKPIFVWRFFVLVMHYIKQRSSLSVYYNSVLCAYALTQIKPVRGCLIWFGCLACQWLDPSSSDPFVWWVCMVSRVDLCLLTVQWRIARRRTPKSRGNMFAGSEGFSMRIVKEEVCVCKLCGEQLAHRTRPACPPDLLQLRNDWVIMNNVIHREFGLS